MDGLRKWRPNAKKRGWKTADKQSVKSLERWQVLDQRVAGQDIEWRRRQGHAGHAGNEYTDRLAKDGVDELSQRDVGYAARCLRLRPRAQLECDRAADTVRACAER